MHSGQDHVHPGSRLTGVMRPLVARLAASFHAESHAAMLVRPLRPWVGAAALLLIGTAFARAAPRVQAPTVRAVVAPIVAPAVIVTAPTRLELRSDTLARMLRRKRVDSVTAVQWARHFAYYAEQLHLNPRLLVAIAYAESEFKPTAYSRAGAVGLMQVVPSRASWGEYESRCGRMTKANLRDPRINICYGSHIYRWFLTSHHGDTDRALSAYNNGSGELNGYADRVYASLAVLRR